MAVPRTNFSKALRKLYDYIDATVWGSWRAVTTGSVAVAATFREYHDKITSGGTEGNESYNLGAAPGVAIGHRKLVTLVTRTHASDAIVLDHANITTGGTQATGAVLNAANEFILVEWRGSKWETIAASAGVVTTA